jgi:hypothetical protein
MTRYPEATVAEVHDDDARSFLVEQGVPTDHLLFRANDPSEVFRIESNDGRIWVCIGSVGESEHLCVDARTGSVAGINPDTGDVWHVNSSVRAFAQSLAVFADGYPFYPPDNDAEQQEQAAERLRRTLLNIDATALREDPGFWNTILFDVANGDYTDD